MSTVSPHDAVAELDRRIANDPTIGEALFSGMVDAEREGGLLHGDRPICPFLRPYLLSRRRYDGVARAAGQLARAFERVAAAALEDDRLMRLLGVSPREERLARVDPGYGVLCVSSRLDAFLTETGFQFLEYNAESPAGVGDQMVLEAVLDRVDCVREFLAQRRTWRPEPHRRLFDAMLAAYREWGGREEHPRVAIVDWAGVPTETEFSILERYFESRGCPTTIGDPHDLRDTGEALELGGSRVDILYKRVLIHELLERFDDSHPLVRAYEGGRVCMMNSFRVKLVHKKASFAVLTDPAYASLFSAEQLDVIRRHVPWTRVVADGPTEFEGRRRDMRELLETGRARLVLKPNDDYGGHDVFVGPATTPAAWREAVETAFARRYVVQAHVPARREPMPVFEGGRAAVRNLTVDLDPFIFANEVEGALVRLSSTALSNISSGGSETALLVLEDD